MRTIPLGILGIWSSKCNYLRNEKPFLNFLFSLWNLQQILKLLKRKMIAIANVFPRLQAVKDLVRPLSKKCRFRTSSDSQNVNGCQKLFKSKWERFYHIFSSLWGKMICKISRLLKIEILGVIVNSLTVDENYPFRDSGDLQFPIEMEFSWKEKTFSQFFLSFIESRSKFNHFQKEDDCHS